jgi:uncharacterized membrane protein
MTKVLTAPARLLATGLLLLALGAAQTPAEAAPLGTSWPVSGRHQQLPEPTTPTPVFVLTNGEYVGFDVPFGESGGDAVGVNNRGQIVGSYFEDPASTCLRGFFRDEQGEFTPLDVPGSRLTQPISINDRGLIVGNYKPAGSDPCPGTDPLLGFLRDQSGQFEPIAVEGALQTQALAINDRDQVAGEYVDSNFVAHGFVWENGQVTSIIDGPEGAIAATALDINDRGQVVGVYRDDEGIHGFQLSNGVYTTIDARDVMFTFPEGINDRGQIAGYTAASLPLTERSDAHGFVLNEGAGGLFTGVDFPGAVLGTVAFDINDAGTIVGLYANPNTTR